ncbi:MAG: hypothetical protein ACPGRZ_16870 [Alphaproteobacteria bacterium]
MSVEAPAQENAMTEIALALAMGFFSLMVLTLISMGVDQEQNKSLAVLALAPSESPGSGDSAAKSGKDLIIIFDGTRFLDTDLKPVDPETVIQSMTGPARRVVLALDPSVSLRDAMAARARVTAPNLVVSTLDDRWVKALEASK